MAVLLYCVVMLNVANDVLMLGVVMPSVVIQNVIMMNVVAPMKAPKPNH